MISMVRMFKQLFGVAILALGIQHTAAFSLLGPLEPYQQEVIGYGFSDLGGPHDFRQEFRRNTPVMYYSMDENFLGFYGANGSNAVVQAFAILNALTNVSSFTSDLSEFPLEAHQINYAAQALNLTDLRSIILTELIENLGLAEPERFTWTLHDREPGTACPVTAIYSVIKRNYDPVFTTTDVLQSSSYVNGTLYSYNILEFCTGPNPLADAVEFAVDPLAISFTSVAGKFTTLDLSGGYFTGLTRDDVGGLRYLLRAGNANEEAAGTNVFTFVTNNTPQLLFTSNLTELVSAALTNNATALSILFPGLQIGETVSFFTNVVTTNFITYLTNFPADPYGTTRSVTVGIVTTNIQTWFSHQFLNVYATPTIQFVNNLNPMLVPGHVRSSNLVTVLTTNISLNACPIGSPYTGLPCTNISLTSFWTNGIFGTYFILPPNLCSVALVSTQLMQNISITNATAVATNAAGTTNAFNESFSQTTFYNYNQYVYVVKPVICPENAVGRRQGVEKIRFEKRDYDSLLNRFFYPVTNTYILNTITNNTLYPMTVQRVVTEPDFLYTAQDLADPSPGNNFIGIPLLERNMNYDEDNVQVGQTGPGVITPGTAFIFNTVGPIYYNPDVLFFINTNTLYSEATHRQWLIWGSFDGTTNAPVVYPNGTDITNLENSVFITLNPVGPALPNATIGVNYTNAFTGLTVASGGTSPYTWAVPFSSPALPPGLTLNLSTGKISGSPTSAGTYDFVIRMNDAAGRYVERPYTIIVVP